ncbi:MAG: sugar ABC transporter permease, partial [Ignavibacteriales bacterium]|nr:sugar ABC transporter permease [Ignavibacteriales bacterium]
TPYLLIAPYILHFAMFVAFPVVFSIVLVFHRWNIISPMEFVGLGNFYRLMGDTFFWQSVINTLYFIIIHVPLQLIIAISFALLLNQPLRMLGFFRAVYFLPVVVSGVVVTILWQQLFGFENGILNRLLTLISLPRVGWLTNPDMAMPSITIMATWKNVGLYVILFLTGLQTVPEQLYEAADLEGANAWQKFVHITLPMINPTIFMVLVLSTIGGFSLFIEPYVMTGGGPLNRTLSSVLYIYKQGFFFYHMGYAATMGVTLTGIILAVVVLQKKYVERNT